MLVSNLTTVFTMRILCDIAHTANQDKFRVIIDRENEKKVLS